MIKLFEEYNDFNTFCKKYISGTTTINSDGSIDVDGSVCLYGLKLTKIPYKFGIVTGEFDCSDNNLTSLEGCPRYTYDFYCSDNKLLKSLEGGPEEVVRLFSCPSNGLLSLKGAPKVVGGSFVCSGNKLTSLKGAPMIIGMALDCSNNQLTTLEGAPKEFGGSFHCNLNPLPNIIKINLFYIKDILRYQDDYSIWNRDGSLNEYRFRDMMEEIRIEGRREKEIRRLEND